MKKNNDIINKFLLVGDKFMPEMHLCRPRIGIYSACGHFTKHTERISKFFNTGLLSEIYKNELDKACFQHDRLTISIKIWPIEPNLILF